MCNLSPWRRQWHPTPVLLPGKSHGWRSLVGSSPWGCQESDTTEQLHFHFSLSCIGEGNGNPLQCSCLENPRDGGAWWAAIYGVAQSRTQLKWPTQLLATSVLQPQEQNSPNNLNDQRKGLSPRAPQYLDFSLIRNHVRFMTYRTLTQSICVILSHKACGNLLQNHRKLTQCDIHVTNVYRLWSSYACFGLPVIS